MSKYKIELHAHTSESSRCGSIEAEEMIQKYHAAGYSALVLTDHYYARFFEKISNLSWKEQLEKYLKGYKAACQAAQKLNFKVFLGLEIKFNDDPNEYLIYGLTKDFLFQHPNLHHLSLEEFGTLTIDQKEDILIFQAHPFRPGMAPTSNFLLDGLEVYNGNPRHDSQNDKALSYAKKHDLKMISGSDFHEEEDLERGGITTERLPADMRELCSLLKNEEYDLIKDEKY